MQSEGSGETRLEPHEAPPHGAEASVAIVDDEAPIRMVMAQVLVREGYRVEAFASAEELLDVLGEARSFDLIFLDLRLPDMQGEEALYRIKQNGSDADVIIMTGYSSVESAVTCMKAGAGDYMPKPFNAEYMRLVAKRVLHRRELERKAIERDVFEKLSKTDGLTGIYNYRFLQELLDVEIERVKRYGSELSLLMIDIDDFKHYNDHCGHPAGDEALCRVADIMTRSARACDYVARYGGEEFAMVLTETGKQGAITCANRVRVAVMEADFADKAAQPLGMFSISVGLAACPEDALEKAEIVRRADDALYQAKGLGKNCVVAWGERSEGKDAAR